MIHVKVCLEALYLCNSCLLLHAPVMQKVYELVVRHFLACVSQPAVSAETTVEVDIAGELFSASGRVILAVSFTWFS